MAKSVLIISGSPQKDGNTAILVDWVAEGARSRGAAVDIVHAGAFHYKVAGCSSCRSCQKSPRYECVIKDEAQAVLARMAEADVIVMATPLYFYGPSAQMKVIIDRMFSLYKWDNDAGTMETPLRGKTLALVLSGFEDVGFEVVERPFVLMAQYTGMKFRSMLIPNAGVSGSIKNRPGVREEAATFGAEIAV